MSEYIFGFIGLTCSLLTSGGLLGGASLLEFLVGNPKVMVAYDIVSWSSYAGMFLLPYSVVRKALGPNLDRPDRIALGLVTGVFCCIMLGLFLLKCRERILRKDVELSLRIRLDRSGKAPI